MPLSPGPLNRIVNVQWGEPPAKAVQLSLGFAADPTALYKDGTPTVVTLSVSGLPSLEPAMFQVNLPEGAIPPPFFEEVYYGGHTFLTMPFGDSGILTAQWTVSQLAGGKVAGNVNYNITKTGDKPFPTNEMQITVIMNLRPLDFLGTDSVDNHYEWNGFGTAVIQGISHEDSKSGRAESAASLAFILNVTIDPPSFTFSAG